MFIMEPNQFYFLLGVSTFLVFIMEGCWLSLMFFGDFQFLGACNGRLLMFQFFFMLLGCGVNYRPMGRMIKYEHIMNV
jgi:hypothetical protein